MKFPNKKYRQRNGNVNFPRGKTFSYRSGREEPAGSRKDSQPAAKKPSKISKVLNAVIVLAILSSLVYLSYINTDPIVRLDEKAIPRDEADYYQAVKDEISRSPLYKNKLSFNSDNLSANIKSRFPEVDNVIIEIPVFRHRPTVNITVSQPVARLITNDKSYILDQEGRALFTEDQINDQFDTSKLVSINDTSGHPVVLGQPVLTEQQINYIREVINQSDANNTPAQAFNLEFGGSAVDIRFQDASYIVKFSFYEDPRQSSGAYFALRKEIEKGNAPTPQKYVDLRIPDKAYLK